MISTFVTLSDYCVVEFKQHPLGDPSPELITSEFYTLKNNHLGLLQVFNEDSYLQATRNVKDISVTPIGGSRLALLDSDAANEYIDYDLNLTMTAVADLVAQANIIGDPQANIVFDTMRFHFASGFNFEEVGALVVGAKHKLNDLRNIILSNIVLDSITAEEILTYNTRPLYLGNSIYDKYIDIKIPSIKYMDANFDQFGPQSLEYFFTEGVGFIKNAPVTVFMQEVNYQTLYAENNEEYTTYMVTQNHETAISQTNEFDNLAATIQEAQDGDYIQFFATWNGALPDDLIATLNERGAGQDWIFIHQLQVYEQVGTAEVPSGNIVIYQEDNFAEMLSYRPILKNAGVAVSMSIDYTLRLFNKSTSENVVRTGSMTIFNPNKYGKYLAKIELDGGPQSQTVYNKVFQKTFETSAFNIMLGSSSPIEVREKKVAAPVFFHKSNVMLSSRNALITSNELGNEVVYGQGKMILPIDPTDNFIRFNIFKKVSTSTQPVPMGLNLNSSFKLTFGKDAKFVFTNMKDAAFENLQYGQIAFKIGREQALNILQSTDDIFLISVVSEDGTESMLYTGKWKSSMDYQAIIANENSEVSQLVESEKNAQVIASLTKKISELEAEVVNWKKKAGTKAIKLGTVLVDPSPNINAVSALPVASKAVDTTATDNTVGIQSILPSSVQKDVAAVIKNKLKNS